MKTIAPSQEQPEPKGSAQPSGSAFNATEAAIKDVIAERLRQDRKWGEQNHDPFTYLTVLMEEVGELAQAALHLRYGGEKAPGLYVEAVHTAAVALAIVECLARSKWEWPNNKLRNSPSERKP